ncbi:MAG: DUF177 domain-containing protein [Burkholderiaceae bacterium]|nr:DUF177 domain-containing protein [Burkholderiaceae bacterium]
MTQEFFPDRLDVKAFALAEGRLAGRDSLQKYERLVQEAHGSNPDSEVNWVASAEVHTALGGGDQIWLHLQVQAILPMECQRCLTPVDIALDVERDFRFVADEATAEALDDESEEDLLALSREFDLRALIEDELLMELPVVPRHETCPAVVPLASTADDFDAATAEKPHPFAALAALRK